MTQSQNNSKRESPRFLGESEGSPPPYIFKTHFWMPVKHEMIYRPSRETPPREESYPIPLKYIDVSRATHTTLDVMQESRIDDYWDIVGTRDMSESWLAFTQSTSMKEKPPDGYTWPGRRLTKQPATSRPEHLWPEIWRSMSKNSK